MADNNQHNNNQKPTLSWSQPASPKVVVPAAAQAKTAAPAVVSVPAEASTNTSTFVGIFAAGIIIGALIGWGISSSKSGGTSTVASSTTMTASSSATTIDLSGSAVGGGTVTIAGDQQAGFGVVVSKVSVQKPTWLVVYEDLGGTAGKALGAVLFYPVAKDGTIELVRPTIAGQSYLVGLSIDNGDNTFSLKNDTAVSDSKGNPLYTEFTAK